jgi:hypothetical protein
MQAAYRRIMGIETGNIRRERVEKNSQAELKLEQADGVGNWSKAHPEAQSRVMAASSACSLTMLGLRRIGGG